MKPNVSPQLHGVSCCFNVGKVGTYQFPVALGDGLLVDDAAFLARAPPFLQKAFENSPHLPELRVLRVDFSVS